MTLQDSRFPHCSEQCSKSSNTMTFIGGSSSALGQLLPPHFQQHVLRARADDVRANEDSSRRMRKVRLSFRDIDSDGECCHECVLNNLFKYRLS